MSKCPTCNEDYTAEYRIPKALPCGHTCCIICIISLFQSHKVFVCQECSQAIYDYAIIKSLPHNHAVLKLSQQLRSQRTRDFSPSNFFSQSTSNPFHDFPDSNSFSSPSFEAFQKHQASMNRSSNDSFNFDGFKPFLAENGFATSRTLNRSYTEPRASRSITPPRKVNDIEINEMGIFREKTPPKTQMHPPLQTFQPDPFQQAIPETCVIKGCNNPKMYLQGSLQAFCNIHLSQFGSPNKLPERSGSPQRIFQSQGFPQQNVYNAFPNMSTPAPTHSGILIVMMKHKRIGNVQRYPNNMFDSYSSQDSARSQHKFGRTTAFDLMRFYEPTPQRTPSTNASRSGMMNSSIFSSFSQKGGQSKEFEGFNGKNSKFQTPFPEMQKELFTPNHANESENKCAIPNCPNQRFVHKGMVWPVCGRRCWMKMQKLSTRNAFS